MVTNSQKVPIFQVKLSLPPFKVSTFSGSLNAAFLSNATGLLSRYNLLISGWKAFRTALMLHSIDLAKCGKQHTHDENLLLNYIQKCVVGLRSGACGGHLNTNVSELIVMFKEAGSGLSDMVHCGHKGMEMVSSNTRVQGLSKKKKNPPTSPVNTRHDRSMISCCLRHYAIILSLILKCAENIEAHGETGNIFLVLVSNFGEPV